MRRSGVLEAPFPSVLRPVLEQQVPLYGVLDAEEREKLERLTLIFLAEKSFEAAGGMELTDEIRAVIAARACLLVLHRLTLDAPLYPDLDVIIVYPSAYRAPKTSHEGRVVIEDVEARLGESWTRGVVVLAWDSVVHHSDAPPETDGHDVVLHEFAHQLDGEDGAMDGAPVLADSRRYEALARVFSAEFAELTSRLESGRSSDIDAYGATNPAEFFAVVSETFFERSVRMRARHPELYAELAAFYRFDPAARLDAEG